MRSEKKYKGGNIILYPKPSPSPHHHPSPSPHHHPSPSPHHHPSPSPKPSPSPSPSPKPSPKPSPPHHPSPSPKPSPKPSPSPNPGPAPPNSPIKEIFTTDQYIKINIKDDSTPKGYKFLYANYDWDSHGPGFLVTQTPEMAPNSAADHSHVMLFPNASSYTLPALRSYFYTLLMFTTSDLNPTVNSIFDDKIYIMYIDTSSASSNETSLPLVNISLHVDSISNPVVHPGTNYNIMNMPPLYRLNTNINDTYDALLIQLTNSINTNIPIIGYNVYCDGFGEPQTRYIPAINGDPGADNTISLPLTDNDTLLYKKYSFLQSLIVSEIVRVEDRSSERMVTFHSPIIFTKVKMINSVPNISVSCTRDIWFDQAKEVSIYTYDNVSRFMSPTSINTSLLPAIDAKNAIRDSTNNMVPGPNSIIGPNSTFTAPLSIFGFTPETTSADILLYIKIETPWNMVTPITELYFPYPTINIAKEIAKLTNPAPQPSSTPQSGGSRKLKYKKRKTRKNKKLKHLRT